MKCKNENKKDTYTNLRTHARTLTHSLIFFNMEYVEKRTRAIDTEKPKTNTKNIVKPSGKLDDALCILFSGYMQISMLLVD